MGKGGTPEPTAELLRHGVSVMWVGVNPGEVGELCGFGLKSFL